MQFLGGHGRVLPDDTPVRFRSLYTPVRGRTDPADMPGGCSGYPLVALTGQAGKCVTQPVVSISDWQGSAMPRPAIRPMAEPGPSGQVPSVSSGRQSRYLPIPLGCCRQTLSAASRPLQTGACRCFVLPRWAFADCPLAADTGAHHPTARSKKTIST